jgi:IS30 family transposase
MAYQHLTQKERYQIYAYRKASFSRCQIAAEIGRSPSTISRELRRNRGRRGYRPGKAGELARRRARDNRCRVRISSAQWSGIAALLKQGLSPQQIAKRAHYEGTLQISHEWIYRYVATDKAGGGQLWRHLRRAGLRRRRYRKGRKRREIIRFRVGIERRPAQVENRKELGHWEGDTIVGYRRQGAALTLVERTSRYVRIGRLPKSDARSTADMMRDRLHQLSARVKSITLDNGTEFAYHPRVARALSTDIYFADPYKPWQRGSNENTNGLIRQYLPKKRRLDNLTAAEVTRIEKRLNHRPRKCLGYLTPHEVFNDTRELLTVALHG